MAIEKNTSAKVTNIQNQIKKLRDKLNDPTAAKSGAERQIILDKIADYNRQIEELTKKERKIVPVTNAPIFMNRSVTNNKSGRARVPFSAL